MAFQQPTFARHAPQQPAPRSHESASIHRSFNTHIEQSQEWVLFSPSQAQSSTNRTETSVTAGLSRASDLGTLRTDTRSGQLQSSVLEEDNDEDGELDSLDEGLHAFREPPISRTQSNQIDGPVLPGHDGLGSFQPSNPLLLEQLWQHEQHNPKRKYEGHHRRASSVLRQLDAVDDIEAKASEEKRVRIEKWRLEQSQALIEEAQRTTGSRLGRPSELERSATMESVSSPPRKRTGITKSHESEVNENEPFWRRITRRFIRDVIGIDEPLLSVILGESLVGDSTIRPSTSSNNLPVIPEDDGGLESEQSWRNRLLERIAKELGVFVHQVTPHPGAFTTYSSSAPAADYAGMPVRSRMSDITAAAQASTRAATRASKSVPTFSPTAPEDTMHAEQWGFEDSSAAQRRRECEHWERDLDVTTFVQYLKERIVSNDQLNTSTSLNPTTTSTLNAPNNTRSKSDASSAREAIIRQYHPLVSLSRTTTNTTANRASRLRRDSRLHHHGHGSVTRRSRSGSCMSESVKSAGNKRGVVGSAIRSGSSRNYWDIGGSVGSGSLLASGGFMGAWGEV